MSDKEINEAYAPMSVTMILEDEIDISRGDMIAKENNCPEPTQDLDIILTWMNEKPLVKGSKLIVKHTSQEIKSMVNEISYEIDINTLHRKENIDKLGLNSIGRISIRLAKQIYVDRYERNRNTGSVILIDSLTFETVGAGMVI